ncbi:hypothetical protein COOONC_06923 [Cooperia oncophora]
MMTGDTIKDYDTITRVITTATQMSTRYEYLPPRLSPRTRDLLQRRRELRHGDNGRGIVEYAEICKLARKSIQEDLRQRHIQIFRQAIKSGRLRPTIEEKSILPPEQAGFRKHFSTIDHIHTINMITEKCHEFNIELCAVFVDFKKAFDSVELPMIWKALEYFGVEENLIMAIQLLYAHSTAAVRIANQLAEFNLQRGHDSRRCCFRTTTVSTMA